MQDLTTNWGETFPFTMVAKLTSGADHAKLIIADVDLNIMHESENDFYATDTELVADLSVSALDMRIEPGEYYYQVNLYYENGTIAKFPNDESDGCDTGDCYYQRLEICATVDTEAES